jgi:transcriptional regulator with XRE-family HTH domain
MKKNISIGEYIKERRIEKGLTQADLSKSLGYTSAQFISNIERETAQPPLKSLKTLMRILAISESNMYSLVLARSEMILKNTIFGSKSTKRKKSSK